MAKPLEQLTGDKNVENFADQNQMIHFLKNVMITGGLLQIVYFGAGPMSVDASRRP